MEPDGGCVFILRSIRTGHGRRCYTSNAYLHGIEGGVVLFAVGAAQGLVRLVEERFPVLQEPTNVLVVAKAANVLVIGGCLGFHFLRFLL